LECGKERLASQRKAHYAKNKDRLHLKQKLDRSARPESYRAYDAAKRAKRRNGHCPWANKEAVQAIYDLAQELTRVTGISHHVDHVIPLVNKSVQGLHVEHNLRIVTAEENLIKGNRVIDGL
jgi:5-methylcytosine-specific restriction endonuclease McrA